MRVVTMLLVGVTLSATALAGRLVVAGPKREAAADVAIGAAPDVPLPPRRSADSLAGAAAARDPFRVTRASAPLPFDPTVNADVPPPPPAPRPPLRLVGIALGTDPAALVEGLPGIEGTRVLRVGEAVAGYTVRRITETHVRITGPDTTWTLTVRGTEP
jgi:hypothetical protein